MNETTEILLSRLNNESKRVLIYGRQHWKKILLGLAIGLPVLALASFLFSPDQPEYVTAVSKRGDLVQTVEGVGTVISEKDLALRFPVVGIVEAVNVKEGDIVQPGQVLATLRNGSLRADVASAGADWQSVRAQLRALEEGARPEDIAIAEAEVENKRAALQAALASLATAEKQLQSSQQKLDVLRNEAKVSLSGYVTSSWAVHNQQLTELQNALNTLEDVFADNIVDTAIQFQEPTQYGIYKRQVEIANTALTHALVRSTPSDYENALAMLQLDLETAMQVTNTIDMAYNLILKISISPTFSQSVKEMHKNIIETERTTAQTAQKALSDATRNLQDASAGYATKIASEESALTSAQGQKDAALADITTYETSLRIQEAQLALTKAGTRKADIDAKRADLNRAGANVQRAQARLDETILTAPIAGRVTHVVVKAGEYADLAEPAVTILGTSPYRVELFAAEVDVPKIVLGQSGAVLLDAYPNKPFLLKVSEIDPAATIRDGVPKYRVKLDFVNADENALKIGMTGDVTIITDQRSNVVSVPGRAVITDANGNEIIRILESDETVVERPVTTGMETDTDIEVKSGVSEGETIVVLVKN